MLAPACQTDVFGSQCDFQIKSLTFTSYHHVLENLQIYQCDQIFDENMLISFPYYKNTHFFASIFNTKVVISLNARREYYVPY